MPAGTTQLIFLPFFCFFFKNLFSLPQFQIIYLYMKIFAYLFSNKIFSYLLLLDFIKCMHMKLLGRKEQDFLMA